MNLCIRLIAFSMLLLPTFGADQLAELKQELRDARSDERKIACLESIAALGKTAEGERSVAAAKALASSIRDDSIAVQVVAVKLLGDGQNVEVAASELLQRAREYHRDEAELLADFEQLRIDQVTAFRLASEQIGRIAESTSEEYAERQEQIVALKEQIERTKKALVGRETLLELRPVLVGSFDGLKDDRAVTGLGVLLGDLVGESHDVLLDALLRHGTGDALTLVVSCALRHREARKTLSKELRKWRREKPRKNPGQGLSDQRWRENELKRINGMVEVYETHVTERDAWSKSLRLRLSAFADSKSLASPPKNFTYAKDWTEWLRSAIERLPQSVSE